MRPARPTAASFSKLRFTALAAVATAALVAAMLPQHAAAQTRKDSVVLGMVLEPAPGLDPTVAPAAAIGEVVHLGVLEGLTKINMDGKITPLLAESWTVDPDGKGLHLQGTKGREVPRREPFTSADVKFEQAKGAGARPARRRRRSSTTSAASTRPTR